MNLDKTQYLILPYINYKKEFSFDNFEIWRNVRDNWERHYGRDNTEFLKRYVDNKAIPLQNIVVITSSVDGIPYVKWERLVHTLFFISLDTVNFQPLRIFSDNFYFEIWEGNLTDPGGGYTKIDKFVKTIVAPTVREKVYPDQYVTLGQEADIKTDSDKFHFFEEEFKKDYDSSLMRSISFFFKTQYRNIAHFSEFDDALNFCTAFQVLLEVGEKRDIAKNLAKRLANQFDINEHTKKRVESWMEKFYSSIRSIYTHSGKTDYSSLSFGNIRHIDIGGIIYELLIDERYTEDIFYYRESKLRQLFESQEIFENVIKLFTRNEAKGHFLFCTQEEFEKCEQLMCDIILACDIKFVNHENKNRIKRALQTFIKIFEHLSHEYIKNGESNFFIDPLIGISDLIKSSKKIGEVIDKLPTFYKSKPPHDNREEIKIRGTITLKMMLDAYEKIRLVYFGHNRL